MLIRPTQAGWVFLRYQSPLGLRASILIARSLRLTSPRDFERVRSTGRSWSGKYVVAIVACNGAAANRYGVAAARKIGNAVRRNRAKRLLRESIRHLHPEIETGHDVVFIARASVRPETKMKEVRQSMRQVLESAGLITSEASEPESPKSPFNG